MDLPNRSDYNLRPNREVTDIYKRRNNFKNKEGLEINRVWYS